VLISISEATGLGAVDTPDADYNSFCGEVLAAVRMPLL